MLVYISTFASPHTLPFGIELSRHYGRVVFVNTMALTEERKRMGYDVQDSRVEIRDVDAPGTGELIYEARDVILSGARFDLIAGRLQAGKPVYLTHERIFKKGLIKLLDPRTWKIRKFCRSVRALPVSLLAIGDNAAADFRRLGFHKDKIYRFGYFPAISQYTPQQLKKTGNGKDILWVGRFVDFKRPIMALKAIKKLGNGYTLTMLGDGKLRAKAEKYAQRHGLAVRFLGNVPAEKVEEEMLRHPVLLSTSHKGEGWGAVINEGMNRGCAVVCSDQIGCYGTLATDKNACIFKTNNLKDLCRALREATEQWELFGEKGYDTVKNSFHAQVAADRFVKLAHDGQGSDEGICSKVFK